MNNTLGVLAAFLPTSRLHCVKSLDDPKISSAIDLESSVLKEKKSGHCDYPFPKTEVTCSNLLILRKDDKKKKRISPVTLVN